MEMDGEQLNRGSDESYGILIGDSDELLRTHRALKRELCFTRTAIIFLMTMCAGFCTLVFFQRVPGCKNEDHLRPNASAPAAQAAHVGPLPAAVRPRPFAFLILDSRDPSPSGHGNVTWRKSQRPYRFRLGDDRTSLVVPETGFYRVDLQITYRQRKDPKDGVLRHLLRRYPAGYHRPIVLMSVFETVPAEDDWIESLFSTNVFILQEGDVLRVEASHLENVYAEEKDPGAATFLTAHLVDAIADPETER